MKDTTLDVIYFSIEDNDVLTVGGSPYYGTYGPYGNYVQVGFVITFYSDSSTVPSSNQGFYICSAARTYDDDYFNDDDYIATDDDNNSNNKSDDDDSLNTGTVFGIVFLVLALVIFSIFVYVLMGGRSCGCSEDIDKSQDKAKLFGQAEVSNQSAQQEQGIQMASVNVVPPPVVMPSAMGNTSGYNV